MLPSSPSPPNQPDDLESHSDESLISRYAQLDARRRALDAECAAVLAELDKRDVPNRQFGHTTKVWVATQTDAPRRQAARDLRVAKLLKVCPALAQALTDGAISIHHVDAIAKATNPRNIDFVTTIQDQLIALAHSYTRFEPWEVQVRDLLAIADQDGGHDPRPETNRLTMSRGLDGDLELRATFTGQWALVVEQTLKAFADIEFRKYERDNQATNGELTIPSRTSLMALAFAEICRNGRASMASGSRGPIADVTLVVHSDDPTRTSTQDGFHVDPHTADLFRCDPAVHPVIINSLGVPMDLGRTVRYATSDQRRALAVRDGGCVFPGCDAPPSWCDAHHVETWNAAGRTNMDNLANLCRHHHGVVHRTGWSMRHIGDQWFEIITPLGQRLTNQRHFNQAA